MAPPKSFTLKHDGAVNVLKTQCTVLAGFDPAAAPDPIPVGIEFEGIWDTGATATAITQGVVDRLGLAPTGMTRVNTASGETTVYTYLVNVILPNGVGFHGVQVSCCQLVGADVLIGMDIIAAGDFAVTCVGGKTCMSFRVPSTRSIDFVAEHHEDARRALIKHRPAKARKSRKNKKR